MEKDKTITERLRNEGVQMKNNYIYPGIISREEDDYLIEFVDFPNLVASGGSIEELIEAAQEVLSLEILEYESKGEEPPEASFGRKDVTYINVWMPFYRSKVKEIYIKKTVTIPQWLDILARENNLNFSACLVDGVKRALNI